MGRVLVIEDELAMAELLSKTMAVLGLEVVVAVDGPAGLDALLHGSFDVALVDLALPGLSGTEIAAAARAAGVKTPLVAVSGNLTLEVFQGDLFADVLSKPLRPTELMDLVANLTGRPEPT